MSERSIWNARDSIDYLQQKTVGRKSTHDCAKFVREAIEAGGVKLNKHHSAKNYKASLITAGFLSLGSAAGRYLPGDIIIIESSPATRTATLRYTMAPNGSPISLKETCCICTLSKARDNRECLTIRFIDTVYVGTAL